MADSTRRRLAVRLSLGLAALASVCVVRAVVVSPPVSDPGAAPSLPAVDPARVADDLAAAVAIPTVSIPSGGEPAAFVALHALLRERFPRVHATLEVTPIHDHARLLHWRGRDPNARPIILTAHVDVVPVEPGTESGWTHPPFSGELADGHVWGRGAMDDKLGVIGILTAVESLLAEGFTPSRDVWIGFGHDEEVGGAEGAVAIAAELEQRGVSAEFLLDEGGAIVSGTIPGIAAPIAFVGIAEKGHASLELTTEGEGGHSSMPPPDGAIARLSRALVRIDEHPMPAALRGPSEQMIDRLTPEQTFVAKLVLANRWMFGPVVRWILSRHPATNAIVRTTTAPTILEAGSADNVLAAHARAVVNFRLLPGDTVASVEAHVVDVTEELGVTVRCLKKCWDPSPVSRTEGAAWDAVGRAILWTWPEAIVSPSLVVGATDARHYAAVADDIYRFLPLRMSDVDRKRLHGTDERIAIDDLHAAVRFYQALLITTTGP
jgi:carboxypeptidase PM20D1